MREGEKERRGEGEKERRRENLTSDQEDTWIHGYPSTTAIERHRHRYKEITVDIDVDREIDRHFRIVLYPMNKLR